MNIMLVGDAPWVPTGYGVQNKMLSKGIRAMGHEISMLATSGICGSTITYDGMKCFPNSEAYYSQDVQALWADKINADIMLTVVDAWVLNPANYKSKAKWVAYYPVDSSPIPGAVAEKVRMSWESATFTRFGQKEAEKEGLRSEYIPNSVDTMTYKPVPTHEARAKTGLPMDAYIVGMVAMNRGDRKGFPQIIEGFSKFAKKKKDAYLYLHTMVGDQGEHNVINLKNLVDHYGLQNRVIFPNRFDYVACGFSDAMMANLYSSMDVLCSPTRGEGFGVPVVEAQACGTPVIVGDWTAMSETCKVGIKIDVKDSIREYTFLNSFNYIAKPEAIASALKEMSNVRKESLSEDCVNGIKEYDINYVLTHNWLPFLQKIEKRLEEEGDGSKNLQNFLWEGLK